MSTTKLLSHPAVPLLVAALLRLPFLASIPNGFTTDEASTGYDAFSILETGRDQHGEFLPLFARSFGDYNESLYRFIAVPFVAVFGLSEFSVRLPAALAGTATVGVLYLLVASASDRRLAWAASLALAINPWHIFFSRTAFRVILFPLLFCAGLYFCLRERERSGHLLAGAACLALALYSYSAARVFVPAFCLGIAVLFWRELRPSARRLLWPALLFGAVLAALATFWLTPQGMARADILLTWDLGAITVNYLSYFDPRFLFFNGDPNPSHSPGDIGQLHLFEMLTVPLGLAALVRERHPLVRAVWLWLALYPVSSALTEPSQALRSLIGVPLFAVLSARGLTALWDASDKPWLKPATVGALAAALAFFAKTYYLDFPRHASPLLWRYGMRQAVTRAAASAYPTVVFSHKLFAPHIFVLFYTGFPPEQYHAQGAEFRQNGWRDPEGAPGFDRFHFAYIASIANLTLQSGSLLLVVHAADMAYIDQSSLNWRSIDEIADPMGRPRIKFIEISAARQGSP